MAKRDQRFESPFKGLFRLAGENRGGKNIKSYAWEEKHLQNIPGGGCWKTVWERAHFHKSNVDRKGKVKEKFRNLTEKNLIFPVNTVKEIETGSASEKARKGKPAGTLYRGGGL